MKELSTFILTIIYCGAFGSCMAVASASDDYVVRLLMYSCAAMNLILAIKINK